MTTRTSRAPRKFSADDAERAVAKNGAPIHLRRAPGIRDPKTELEAAIQRFVDLYDFAPIAYVSFDRAGRIEEANLAATELLGEPRDLLIGLALLPQFAATGGDGIAVEAEKRRTDAGTTSKYADHFNDEKWRAALSNRHHRFDRP